MDRAVHSCLACRQSQRRLWQSSRALRQSSIWPRRDVALLRFERSPRETVSLRRFLRPAGVLLGVVIVLATALPLSNPPLSKDQGGLIQRLGFDAPDLRLEFVTEDEGRLLNLLRESLSSTREEQFADFQVSEPSLSRNERAEMPMPSRPEASSQLAPATGEAPVSTEASSVSLEEFLTLVQVGERATEGEDSPIILKNLDPSGE